jgi:hypothetical protein
MVAPPRSHPLARAKAAQWADRAVQTLWDRGVTPKPPLDPDYLWQVGSRGFDTEDERSIRSEAEVADFRERLERLCASLRDEARLNALGHTMAYGQLTSAIRKRHALGQLWRDDPGLAQGDIAAPIIVIGQMRAGTTRLHRLLAADPRHAGTRFCNSHDPVPATPDLRPLKARAALMLARRINPWLETIHPFGATRIDEEIGWLVGALSPATFETQWRIPSFIAWNEARDARPVYAEFSRILRTDAATMGNAHQPRVLKCPQFSEDLPSLRAQFSNAKFVVTHRDHEDILDSSVSLVSSQMAFQSDHADLSEIRREWRRKLVLRDERLQAQLTAETDGVVHVDFDALGHDWQAEIARIYKEWGIELSREALLAMVREQHIAAAGHHHRHRTDIARFGLSRNRAKV